MVLFMNGPAIEIAALDSHIAMQLQAEAQQKQCDYILYSSVAVKHGSSGGFGKFMKMAAPVASMVPMAGMSGGMGGAMAAQAAGAAASAAAMSAQQQAMNQLAGFNGQIKQKDDVTVAYQLFPTGQDKAVLENSLKAKAKSDGEDVLTPLIQQTASAVLTQVTKK
jgi:outer membrane lipoprotein SlyB